MARSGRPVLARAARDEFWRLWRSGMLVHDASMAAGIGETTAHQMVRERGGIAPPVTVVSGRFLMLAERIEIQAGVA